tara:strand:+ start:1902 stop:2540 length:639 start_codon:yes stop_codon:yes gene_type:complete
MDSLMVNKDQDWKQIRDSIFSKGSAVIDNFFDVEFALTLREKILNNYKDAKPSNRYPDYILKDADEKVFPSIQIANDLYEHIQELKDTYSRSWVGVFENKGNGTSYHYDWESLVTLNIWLTPNECVQDFSKNGLLIFPIQVPQEVREEENPLVSQAQFVEEFMGLHKHVEPIEIKYNFNRAVFQTSLLHATNGVSMKDGEDNKRVSMTILFR